MDIKKAIRDLHVEIAKAKRLGLSLHEKPKGLTSFDKARATHVLERIKTLRDRLSSKTGKQLPDDIDALDKAIMTIPISETQLRAPRFPSPVSVEMNADFSEMMRCLDASCFRSAIILCARMLETALHCKYYETTGVDLLEKSPGIGLGNLIRKLSEKGVLVDPALGNQVHLINQVRVHSVHKKQNVFEPSEDQAKAIVMYTMDAVRKLFSAPRATPSQSGRLDPHNA